MSEKIPDSNQVWRLFAEETSRLETLQHLLQDKFDLLQQKLEESHHTLEQIISHMSDGLIFVTMQGAISLFNQAAEKLTGISRDHIIGSPFKNHFSDTLFGFSMKEALETNLKRRVLLTLTRDQLSKEIEITVSPIPGKGLLLLLQDRSEMKQLEKSAFLNERLKELGEMAATLAHEIRNPLGGIAGFAALLQRDIKEAEQREMILAIIEGVNALNRLVANVLDYTRPLSLNFTHVNLHELIRETIHLTKADPSALPCELHMSSEPFFISADKQMLKSALLNLFRNAFEASAKPISVSLETDGSIRISDQGPGMHPSHIEKLFTPFFTTKATGTGLGLVEAYKTVQAHGGTLSVQSTEGKGTTFIMKLPGYHGH